MNFLHAIDISGKVLKALALKKRHPFGVGWNITHRCNLKCDYCKVWPNNTPEMDIDRVLVLIDELASLGTKFITFSGGEPLLYKGIGRAIDRSREKGIHVSLNTNGTLVKKYFNDIKNINEAQVSLDGPPEINDAVRGRGVYDKAIEAIKVFSDHGIPVNISMVITRHNIDSMPYMLDLAEKFKAGIYVHPADPHGSGDSQATIATAPSVADFQKVVRTLMEEKKRGRTGILSSMSGLKHLANWPEPTPIFCMARLLFCNIEPDGTVVNCDMCPNYRNYRVPITKDFKATFDQLKLPEPCIECWCASTVEFNMVGSLKPDAMLDVWRRFRREV